MIRVKDDSVEISQLSNGMLIALMVADRVYAAQGVDAIVTSGHEQSARHSLTSLHYSGNAVDLRTRHLTEYHKRQVAEKIGAHLGRDYDVILEPDHLHIECQPRRRM